MPSNHLILLPPSPTFDLSQHQGLFKWNGCIFPFLLCFSLLFFSQLFVRPPQTTILPFCISFSWSLPPVQCHELLSIVLQALCLSDLYILLCPNYLVYCALGYCGFYRGSQLGPGAGVKDTKPSCDSGFPLSSTNKKLAFPERRVRLREEADLCLAGPNSFLVQTDVNTLKCWSNCPEPIWKLRTHSTLEHSKQGN